MMRTPTSTRYPTHAAVLRALVAAVLSVGGFAGPVSAQLDPRSAAITVEPRRNPPEEPEPADPGAISGDVSPDGAAPGVSPGVVTPSGTTPSGTTGAAPTGTPTSGAPSGTAGGTPAGSPTGGAATPDRSLPSANPPPGTYGAPPPTTAPGDPLLEPDPDDAFPPAIRRPSAYPVRLVARPMLLPPWFIRIDGAFGVGDLSTRCVTLSSGATDCATYRSLWLDFRGEYGITRWLTIAAGARAQLLPFNGRGRAAYFFRFAPLVRGHFTLLAEAGFDNSLEDYRRANVTRSVALRAQWRFGDVARARVGLMVAALDYHDDLRGALGVPLELDLSLSDRVAFEVSSRPTFDPTRDRHWFDSRARLTVVLAKPDDRPVLEGFVEGQVPYLGDNRGPDGFAAIGLVGLRFLRVTAPPAVP